HVRIETGRDQQYLGPELIEFGQDPGLHHPQVLKVTAARQEGNVQRVPPPAGGADFPVVPASRVAGARILVKADKQDRRVIIKAGLRAVAVVNVEVDDGDAPNSMPSLKIA